MPCCAACLGITTTKAPMRSSQPTKKARVPSCHAHQAPKLARPTLWAIRRRRSRAIAIATTPHTDLPLPPPTPARPSNATSDAARAQMMPFGRSLLSRSPCSESPLFHPNTQQTDDDEHSHFRIPHHGGDGGAAGARHRAGHCKYCVIESCLSGYCDRCRVFSVPRQLTSYAIAPTPPQSETQSRLDKWMETSKADLDSLEARHDKALQVRAAPSPPFPSWRSLCTCPPRRVHHRRRSHRCFALCCCAAAPAPYPLSPPHPSAYQPPHRS